MLFSDPRTEQQSLLLLLVSNLFEQVGSAASVRTRPARSKNPSATRIPARIDICSPYEFAQSLRCSPVAPRLGRGESRGMSLPRW